MAERYEFDQVSVRMVKDAPLLCDEPINTPEDAVRILADTFHDYDREVVGVVHLRSDNKPINMTIVSMGCLNQSIVHPREMLKAAFLSNAAAIMMFHNHPSGELTPSKADISITDRMQKLCTMAGIPVLDHIILGNDQYYYSFRERDMLPMNEIHYSEDLADIDLKVAEKEAAEYGYKKETNKNYAGASQERRQAHMANTRFTYTPEQRQQQVQELTQRLEEGVKNVFDSENYAAYLKVMSKFTHYSVRNTILIALQTGGTATMVAGYDAWQRNFGRHVNKGEKAIKIFAPMTYKKKKEQDVIDQATGQPVRNADGSVMKEEVEVTVPSFRIANVFDISQTSGPPLPTLVEDLEGNVERYRDFVQAIRNISPVPVGFEEMEGKDGYYHQVERRIAINEDLSERQAMAAMIHELAHAKLHALDPEHLKESAKARGKDQRTMEVEAESISAVVSSYFGIDTSANSWGYVASWSKNKDLPELTASLQVIKDTAGEIIDGLVEEMEELRFAYIGKEEAMEAMSLGETIYRQVARGRFEEITAREVLELPDDAMLRMPKDQLAAYAQLRREYDLHEEPLPLKEVQLLYMPEAQFGIYQIDPDTKGHEYMFTSHESMMAEELVLDHEDYDLTYVAPLGDEDTLDGIYERFNIDRPEDFTGHSLSVSDIVVTNRNGEVRAYFVDSFGFTEVTDEFLGRVYERPEEMREAAFRIEDRYLEIHETEGGWDYSIYSKHYQLLDGGRYESDVDLLTAAKDIVQDLREPVFNTETQTYERLPVQGNIGADSRMRRTSLSELIELTQEFGRVDPASLDGQVREDGPQERYRPLAKVEEMEEQNYDQIDDVLNNGAGEKEKPVVDGSVSMEASEEDRLEMLRQRAAEYQAETGATITFYAAVCEEFHDMEAYYGDLTLEEVAEKYREIRSDPRLGYFGNSMGIILHDPVASPDMDLEWPLVQGDTVCGSNMDESEILKKHPMVLETVERVREHFPEYAYLPMEVEKQALYPEQMTADGLAGALMDLARDFDGYEFMDTVEDPEAQLMDIKYNLLLGLGPQEYTHFLKDVREESEALAPRAEVLLERIKAYEPKLDQEIEPVVRFSFSQDKEIQTGIFMPLREADALVRDRDRMAYDRNLGQENERDRRAYIVELSVFYAEGDQLMSMSETIFLGEGKGGLMDHLREEVANDLTSESWLDHMRRSDPEHVEQYMQDLRDVQERVLPYLQQFVSLEERAPEMAESRTDQSVVDVGIAAEATVGQTAGNLQETANHPGKAGANPEKAGANPQKRETNPQKQMAKSQKSEAAPKKSIHERLKENKEKLSKSGRPKVPQKGVELA